MRILVKVSLLAMAMLCLTANLALADPNDVDATCSISCTVDGIMEWSGNFPTGIDLGTMTSQSDVPDGNDTTTLYTNGNVDITADNTATAQLSNTDPNSSDTLVTEYMLEYDGNGSGATGGSTVSWTAYNTFLSGASVVTHVSGDGAVDVTLGARASMSAGEVADSGSYSATQKLTASWGTQ